MARSADWPSMCNCLNGLEESSNFCVGVLQANLANKTVSITWIGLESQMLCMSLHYCLPVMANSISFVFLLYCPVLAWSDVHNVLIIFLAYLSIHTSAVRYPKQNQQEISGKPVINAVLYLPFCWNWLRCYCMMILAFDTPSSNYSIRRCISLFYRSNRMIAGLLQSIQTITLAFCARILCLNQKHFLTVQ